MSPGPGNYGLTQGVDGLQPGAWSLGAGASLMVDPLVLRDVRSGEQASAPVELRLGVELTMALGIASRLQVGAAIPMVAFQRGDRLQGIGLSEKPLASVATGDARLHLKFRLSQRGAALRYGVSARLGLPTGDTDHFAGDKGLSFAWTLLGEYSRNSWRIAANLGLRLRSEKVALLSPARAHGNELLAMLATEYVLPEAWNLPLSTKALLEYAAVKGDDNGPSPAELRLGVVLQVAARARLKLIYGRGTTSNEIGSPRWRLASVFEISGP